MAAEGTGRRSGELTLGELLRWAWRQLTSMRTALVLLLLLALAAIPGSVIPQAKVDALKTSQWREAHPQLTPVYDRLGLFDVYGTPWFAAIYLLLTISLVGCFVPRIVVYARALRAQPPATPRGSTGCPTMRRTAPTSRPPTCSPAPARLLRGQRVRADDPAIGLGGRRARLPPRGRQPAVPRLGAGRDDRVRDRQPSSATRAG